MLRSFSVARSPNRPPFSKVTTGRATRAGATERRKLQEGSRVADLASVGWLRASSAMPQGRSEFNKAAVFVGAAAVAATELLAEGPVERWRKAARGVRELFPQTFRQAEQIRKNGPGPSSGFPPSFRRVTLWWHSGGIRREVCRASRFYLKCISIVSQRHVTVIVHLPSFGVYIYLLARRWEARCSS